MRVLVLGSVVFLTGCFATSGEPAGQSPAASQAAALEVVAGCHRCRRGFHRHGMAPGFALGGLFAGDCCQLDGHVGDLAGRRARWELLAWLCTSFYHRDRSIRLGPLRR